MARAYRMTSARRAAIKKAQAASARKRKGKNRKRAAIGAAAIGVGVLGVTLAKTRSGRKKSRGPVSVIGTTVEPAGQVSTSKELDILRVTLDSPGDVFGHLGKPEGSQLKKRELSKKQNKADKAAKGKGGKGVFRVGEIGSVDKVLRNRPKFNDDRRNGYSPGARREKYLRDKARKQGKKNG